MVKEKEHKTNTIENERNDDQPVSKTRSEKHKQTEEKPAKNTIWVQIRLFPIWLRLILVLLLFAGVAALGLYVGYSVVGDGSPGEIFQKETWTHITDIIRGVE